MRAAYILAFLVLLVGGVFTIGLVVMPKWNECRRDHGMVYCRTYMSGGWKED